MITREPLVPLIFAKDVKDCTSLTEIDSFLRRHESGEICLTNRARNLLQVRRKSAR